MVVVSDDGNDDDEDEQGEHVATTLFEQLSISSHVYPFVSFSVLVVVAGGEESLLN